MKLKDLTKDAEEEWEKGALGEVMDILRAVLTWHPVDFKFVIAPLPLALFEVYRQLKKQRPMRPSDIHSAYDQASTSRLAYMRPDKNDPGIPPDIGLGNPATFWWKDLETRTPRKSTPWSRYTLKDLPIPPYPRHELEHARETDESDLEELAQKHRAGTKRTLTDIDESEESRSTSPPCRRSSKRCRRSSKRHRSEPPSDSEDSDYECRYVYYPKCDSCEDQGWVCHVSQSKSNKLWGACSPCKLRKHGCSAIRGKSRVVKRISDKRNDCEKESILSRLRPRKSASTTIVFQHTCASNGPYQDRSSGGGWKWQKRVEHAATAHHHSSTPSGLQSPSRSLSSDPITHSSSSTPASMTSSESGPETTTTPKRELADKSVGTDDEPLGRLGPQESEFLQGLVSLILQTIQAHQSRLAGVKKEDRVDNWKL
ncbi:hypothetical protein JVT61DRAFT_6825 [Boletus reticuloceps]|uniref:Uncharacterized protein n=1 Tax=Boletus reticuloceps TaxID=495285 RepID=A0A8I3A7N6_9AGAM|nr:hypothetical protein JVT61DRAFT_6825 [Boletus reticuloceps]